MKKILFFFATLLTVSPMFAQTEDDEELLILNEKDNVLSVGLKLGGTFTTMTQPKECDLYDGMGIGLSAGLAARFRFGTATEYSNAGTGRWGAGFELKYKQNNVKTIATDESGEENADLSLSYFEVPIFAQFYPLARNRMLNTLYFELGVAFAGTLGRSPEALTVSEAGGEYGRVTYMLDTDDSTLKGFDVRPLVGIGYSLPGTGLDINARYCMGTSDLAGNMACKISSFEISVAWMFNAFKF